MTKNWRDPIHPGEILADELKEIGMNGKELAVISQFFTALFK